jgi:hypothetical protein
MPPVFGRKSVRFITKEGLYFFERALKHEQFVSADERHFGKSEKTPLIPRKWQQDRDQCTTLLLVESSLVRALEESRPTASFQLRPVPFVIQFRLKRYLEKLGYFFPPESCASEVCPQVFDD